MGKSENTISYPLFETFKNIVAFTTTKQSFESENHRFTGDGAEEYIKNRKTLAKLLDINENQLVFPRQTHTNCVVELRQIPTTEIKETDALVTNQPGICICVQTADCVPILMFDAKNKVISAVHAGWRGTVKNIVGESIRRMELIYQSNPKNIFAAIGPSISPEIYEVGNEVVEEVRKTIPNPEKTLHENAKGKYHFNLWEANKQLLLQSGLHPENIEISGDCSFLEDDKFFSARRDGIGTGRMVSGIMIKESAKNS